MKQVVVECVYDVTEIRRIPRFRQLSFTRGFSMGGVVPPRAWQRTFSRCTFERRAPFVPAFGATCVVPLRQTSSLLVL
jgi:hypothetical protein